MIRQIVLDFFSRFIIMFQIEIKVSISPFPIRKTPGQYYRPAKQLLVY
ncbi:MAG: hypothetical protein IJT36_01490 [Alphaproteobacteria bacterium]|nr:hypothetical protein [Alphaproteobacteria bacterium]